MPQYTYVESSGAEVTFLKKMAQSEELNQEPDLISANNPNEKEIEKKRVKDIM